ncbi:MAG TPA: cytochrome-c peroxidase, partial [Candidatus Kapabacteria bacterium]|nr:cytochrome-c peroxidase [Candidatus Kapabacteria bacterium]
MRNRFLRYGYCTAAIICLVYICCAVKAGTPSNVKEAIRSYYLDRITAFDSSLAELQHESDPAKLQQQFLTARLRFKELEVFAEYYTAGTARAINSPAREEIPEEDLSSPAIKPIGLQVIEQYLFPKVQSDHEADYRAYIKDARQYINNLRAVGKVSPFTDSHTFDAVRIELFRIITLGITGFDCPIARNAIAETEASLRSCSKIMAHYQSDNAVELVAMIDTAAAYCAEHKDFNSFDRAVFISQFINPTCIQLAATRDELHIIPGQDRRLLSASAKTMFSFAGYDPNVYSPQYNMTTSPEKIELGRMLFFDPVMSANGKRSCASCHDPKQAFTDGKARSTAFEFEGTVDRNAPTILNAALQREYFFDSRVMYLEDQITAVVTSHKEFRCSYEKIATALSASKEYKELFAKAFTDEPTITGEHIRGAVASYVRSLVSMNSPFDKYMQGDVAQLNVSQIRGFNLFMGKAQCGTCHFVPLFNGTVPPQYEESEWEVLGVPSTADTQNVTLDNDIGRFALGNK